MIDLIDGIVMKKGKNGTVIDVDVGQGWVLGQVSAR